MVPLLSVERNFGIESHLFRKSHFDRINKFAEAHSYHFTPLDSIHNSITDTENDSDLVADVDPDTLICIVRTELKNCKAPGIDNVHNIILKKAIGTGFYKVFNETFRTGHGKTSSKTSGRQPFFSKYQSGFRKSKSTNDHLFRLSQTIMESFNRGEHVIAASVDVEKAFDNVWHNGLKYKIYQLDLPTKLSDFLVGRVTQVKTDGFLSPKFYPRAGVPQGSNLSPSFSYLCQ